MKRTAIKLHALTALVLIIALMSVNAQQAPASGSASMTVWQARRAVVAAMGQKHFYLNTHNINVLNLSTVGPGTIRFAADSLEFDG